MRRYHRFTTEMMEKELQNQVSASELVQFAAPQSLSSYLNHLMGMRNLSTDVLAELSALNRASLYKILNGSTKMPQRNVLLRLALTMQISFQETQQLLKCGGRATLSGNRGRDIIISDGIIHKKGIEDINERLKRYNFLDLYGKE